ncbi:RNA methyltransferase [Saccharothrix sp. NRRL B-16348]|uniref:TfoX/Sxy family protein n=1 Tax=Saccharothrix sp. NRRL B-16348 TaxID=1415542 RepID=UPI0006AE2DB1|nr:TfoX/Sxy family protein [Saccharothrix sp. NRRL B-16348]KOX18511.1 RNA methyltransferase [Saccharothrix sp. NRRL B-16348]
MAFDEHLAERIRDEVGDLPGISAKRMFGGVAFLLHGTMLVGVTGDDMIARVGPDAAEECLALPGTRVFDFTGKVMRGWVVVDGSVLDEDSGLADWIGRAREFVETLPPK